MKTNCHCERSLGTSRRQGMVSVGTQATQKVSTVLDLYKISKHTSDCTYFKAAALAVFVFVPPSQPLSKYHVVINAGALAFANPVPGSLTRTTKFYATQFSVHRFSDHAGVEQTVK